MKQADLKYPDVRIPAEKRLPTGFLRTGNFHRGSALQNTKIQRKLLATYARALLGILKSHVKTQLQLQYANSNMPSTSTAVVSVGIHFVGVGELMLSTVITSLRPLTMRKMTVPSFTLPEETWRK